MENLTVSLNTVLYMLLIMLLGRRVIGRIPEKELVITHMNKLVFSVFLPLMVFQNIYTTDLKTVFDGKLLLYMMALLCGIWLLLMLLTPKWISDRRTCGAFIQGCVRSNSIIFGIPIVSGLFAGEDLGCPTMMTAIATIGFNVIGVITLEVYRGKYPDTKKILRNLIKNPVLLASVLAIPLAMLRLRLPAFLEKSISTMAGMASPMGLLLIGASLRLNLRENARAMSAALFLRLAAIPAIGLLGAAALGWRGIELCTVLIIMASPTSVSAYSMAQVMDSDGTFAANQVGLSSVLGAGTVFLWIVLLEMLRLL